METQPLSTMGCNQLCLCQINEAVTLLATFEVSLNSLVRSDKSVRCIGLITLRKISTCDSNKFVNPLQISLQYSTHR